MSRKNRAPVRSVLPDLVFNSKVITKLINTIMKKGKKVLAQKVLYRSFDLVKEKTNQDPMEVFKKAIENITPQLEVRTRRIGGANYQVPVEVTERRKMALSLRWLVKYAVLRSEKTIEVKLANEIIDASKGVGGAVKKKDESHRMAEANRAFAHYRW
ncbi:MULTISPECIES: 30S ribosomal protein S7 [unclassified Mycoplasma]|uniref:30S ribosomal protein S7 n=1 Tax=unclassified Mycoplasma TaxID=2683645 RepID=UPI000FDE81EB